MFNVQRGLLLRNNVAQDRVYTYSSGLSDVQSSMCRLVQKPPADVFKRP